MTASRAPHRAATALLGAAPRPLPIRRRLLWTLSAAWAVGIAVLLGLDGATAAQLLLAEAPLLLALTAAASPRVNPRLQAAAVSAGLAMAAATTAATGDSVAIAIGVFCAAAVMCSWYEDRAAMATFLAVAAVEQVASRGGADHPVMAPQLGLAELAAICLVAAAAAVPWRYNAMRERALIDDREDLIGLGRIAKSAAISDDPRGTVVLGIADLVGAHTVGLCELAMGGEELLLTRSLDPAMRGARFTLRGAPSGLAAVMQSGEALFVADTDVHPLTRHALIRHAGVRSLHYEPIFGERGVSGVLVIGWDQPNVTLGEHRRSLITLAASEAAIAIRRDAFTDALRKQALTDPLTGAANRRAFDEQLRGALLSAEPQGSPIALAMLDLNGFKTLNDTEGHAAGDELLRHCVALWTNELQAGDLLARLGGDEFAVLLCRAVDSGTLRERLRGALQEHTRVDTGVGVVQWDGAESAEDLMRRADELLYADKAVRPRPKRGHLSLASVDGLPTDPDLQRLTDGLARTLQTQWAMVSIIVGDRQHIVALTGPQLARSLQASESYCHYPAATGRELIVDDTAMTKTLRRHPATSALGARAYAGIPILVSGEVAGVACGIDTHPRPWTPEQLLALRDAATTASSYIESLTHR